MLNPVTLYSSTECRVDHFRNAAPSKKVVFTFTAMSHASLDGMGWAGEFLTQNGFDVVAFKTAADKWYQNIPVSTLNAIARYTNTQGYESRVAYGGSMGAFAAIAFSSRFKFEVVLAFAPQYRIDQDYDTRWKSFSTDLEWIHSIAPDTVSAKCRYFLVYDDKSADWIHVDFIRKILGRRQTVEVKLPYAGHMVGEFLRDTGGLKGLALEALNGNDPNLSALWKERCRSNHYLCGRAEAALASKRPATALRLINAAIEIDPRNAYYRSVRGDAFLALQDRRSALSAMEQALSLAPNDHNLLLSLSDLLADEEALEDAVSYLDDALAHLPGNEWILQKKAALVARMAGEATSKLDETI